MNLSQNFIKSPQLVRDLIKYTNLNPDDIVVEIGPGKGVITQELLKITRKVISIEKDISLIPFLKNKFSSYSNLKLINQDFLLYPLPSFNFKIFSNIPFSITANILDKILKSKNKPAEIYFILQSEAAQKYYLSDQLNNQDAILLAPFYFVEIIGDIDRTAFTPKPQVNIVFTKFTLRDKPLIDPDFYQQFRDFIIFGFNQWQPNIFEVYKKIFSYEQFKKINHQLKINHLKPTELSFPQWKNLFEIYQKFTSNSKKQIISGFEKQYHHKTKPKKF